MRDTRVHKRGSRLFAWLGAALLTLGLVAAPSPTTASVQSGDAVSVGTGTQGYGGTKIFPIWFGEPGTGEPDAWAYCIEHDVSARTGAPGIVGDPSEYLGDNLFGDTDVQGKVMWVLAHSYPAISLEALATAAGITNLTPNDAIEGAQYAIWRYTDLGWDADWNFTSDNARAVYWHLVNAANAAPAYSPTAPTVEITAPASTQSAGGLAGPFTVTTNQPSVAVSAPGFTIVDATGTTTVTSAVNGQELYLDLRGSTTAGNATVTASTAATGPTGHIVSVPNAGSTTPTEDAHRQSLMLVFAEDGQIEAQAGITWSALEVEPTIGTSLVDSADQDKILPWSGGTVVDTISYQNLKPGTEYTVTGELMNRATELATGIVGSTTFTPTEANGSVEVSFAVPQGLFAGRVLVAFERLYEGAEATGDPVAVHEDIEDAAQTVVVQLAEKGELQELETSLLDSADSDRVLPWSGGTVIDTVTYRGLTPGLSYQITGELMNKADGTGTGILGSSAVFTAADYNGSVDVTFVVPEGYAGMDLVAFEWAWLQYDNGRPPTVVTSHEDINDAAQTVTVEEAPVVEAPVIGTSLVDSADQDRVLGWNGGTVVDTISYQNLVPGVDYYINGELMNKADGSGTGITVEDVLFTPTEANGTVDVTFIVPEGYAGGTLVAFEQIWRYDLAVPVVVAKHEDIDDAAQTVTVEEAPVVEAPVIGTSLVDSADQDRVLGWNGGTVVDTVAYQNLVPGTEYTVTGELMLKADGTATGITGSATFTPTNANGSVDVTFVVPTGFDGDVLVAYERLFEGDDTTGEPVAVHEDINDAAQTVTVEEAPVVETPVIGTSLVDSADQDRVLGWNGGTVVDTVAYQNLVPGTEYTVTGELMLKADGTATGITGSATFTPTEANGSVEVTFVVPTGFAGDVLVAYEQLFEGTDTTGEPVAVHEDINDAAQTVTVEEAPVVETPVIGTSLVDSADQDRVLGWNGGTVVDTVAYQNLVPGTEYTVTGELMLKADGAATGITGSTTFTPTDVNGSVDVTFVVPTGFDGDVLVAYEQLFEGDDTEGEPVAVHEDINDAAQTVTVEDAPVVETPVIGTSLVDSADQDHVLTAKGGTVIDTVAYQNLVPGTEYTVTGELMLKADGSATGITGSATFIAKKADGSVDVTFVVPAGFDGDVLVAFERLFEGDDTTGEPIAVHEDINDAAQTVTVEKAAPVKPGSKSPDDLAFTGTELPWVWLGMASIFLIGGMMLVASRRKRIER